VRARLYHGGEEGDVGDGVGDEASVAEEIPALSDEVRGRRRREEAVRDGVVGREEGRVTCCFHRVQVTDGELGVGGEDRVEKVVVGGDGQRERVCGQVIESVSRTDKCKKQSYDAATRGGDARWRAKPARASAS